MKIQYSKSKRELVINGEIYRQCGDDDMNLGVLTFSIKKPTTCRNKADHKGIGTFYADLYLKSNEVILGGGLVVGTANVII